VANEFVPGERYVRLTFKPHGSTKRRTVWAERAGHNKFWVINRQSQRPEPQELVLTGGQHTLQPAVMSRHYGMLFVQGDPEFKP
jgi:hypothetical protein